MTKFEGEAIEPTPSRSGSGHGKGIGPGGPEGSGGGSYNPGGLVDRVPILVFEPELPPYPPKAREHSIRGEVILQILVRIDGSAVVIGPLKSVPYCMEAAIETARKYKWKPALRDGKPVEHQGVLMVRFDFVAR